MLRFSSAPKKLPKATGPYYPGCIDLMLDYSETSLFTRVFYPTNIDNKPDEDDQSHRWLPWIPEDHYVLGIAKVLMCWIYMLRLVFWWMGQARIPAIYGGKIRTDNKLKCIIFSHGLGTARFIYSSICYELASRGFLVLMLEHREGSSCTTYYYKSKEDAEKSNRTYIEFKHCKLDEHHYNTRSKQIDYRINDFEKALDFLINLNKGEIAYNILNDEPNNCQNDFDFNDLIGRLDLESITAMGHSFGGATALKAMTKRSEFKQGVILDPWMFPIKSDNLVEALRNKPIVFVNTQTFHIAINVNAMANYLDDAKTRTMYTILHTTHESQTDTAALIGYWLSWFMKKLHPWTALKINNSLILQWLDDTIGCPTNIEDCRDYLNEQKENFEYGLTKPWA